MVVHACNPSTFGRPRWTDHLRSGVLDQSGQHSETPSLLKIQKLARRGGVCLESQLLGKLRQDNCLNLGSRGCSELRLRRCTPTWRQSETRSQKTKQKASYLKRLIKNSFQPVAYLYLKRGSSFLHLLTVLETL